MQGILLSNKVIDGTEVQIFLSNQKENDEMLLAKFLFELCDFLDVE